jgi:hypothetical protein
MKAAATLLKKNFQPITIQLDITIESHDEYNELCTSIEDRVLDSTQAGDDLQVAILDAIEGVFGNMPLK